MVSISNCLHHIDNGSISQFLCFSYNVAKSSQHLGGRQHLLRCHLIGNLDAYIVSYIVTHLYLDHNYSLQPMILTMNPLHFSWDTRFSPIFFVANQRSLRKWLFGFRNEAWRGLVQYNPENYHGYQE